MATQIGELKYSVGFDVKKQDLNTLKKQLQQIKQLSLSDLMKINQTDRESAVRALSQIKDQAENVERALRDAFNVKLNSLNVESFNKSLTSTGSSLQKVYNTFQKGGAAGENAFRSLVTQVTTTNTQLKQTHKFLDNIATTLGNTIKWNLASTAVNTLSNSVQQAWGYVKSLDTSLNDIRIVTGKSADQMVNFAVQANDAAKSLGKTTVDYTKAALIYAQQGLSDDEVAARAAITLKTANVTGQSADAVSEQLTSVWNGYKVNAEQAELYVDRLAAVAATTASDLQELSTGMSKVASAAAAMGVGEDQLAAQLSTIISVTRQAPESVGTALRTIYARISDIKAGIDEDGVDLGRYSGKMAELGFNVLDVNGKLRDMGQVIEDIGGRWQTLTREQQVSLAQTMAGQRQYSNLIALFDNFQEYNKALNTAQNAAGTLQKQQDIYMDDMKAHLNQLKAATEDLYDSLINADSMKPLIDGLTTVVNLAAKFVDALGGGGNVLITLGGVAANVFSKQLTDGVMTFANNLTLASKQADEIKVKLQTLQESRNIKGLDENTKGLFDKSIDYYTNLAQFATPQQYQEYQNQITNLTGAINNLKTVQEELAKQNGLVQAVQKLNNKYKTFEEVVNLSEKQYNQYIESLKQSLIKYDNVKNKIQEIQNAIEQLNKNDPNFQPTGFTVGSETQEKLTKLYDQAFELRNLFSTGLFQDNDEFIEQRKILSELIETISRMRREGFSQEDSSKIEEVKNKLGELAKKGRQAVDALSDGAAEAGKQLDDAKSKVKNAGSGINNFFKNLAKEENIHAIGRLVGSVTQLTTSVRITSNAVKELKQGNIEAGLTGLVTSLTSVITAAISAGKAIQALSKSVALGTGFGIALVAVEALVSVLVGFKKAAEQAREQAIKLGQENIKLSQQKQQEIKKNQDLNASIAELNNQYKNGQIAKIDLISKTEQLVSQYQGESQWVQKLTQNYEDWTQQIKKNRKEMAGRQTEQGLYQLRQAETVIQKRLEKKNGFKDGNYKANLPINTQNSNNLKLANALSQINGVNYENGILSFSAYSIDQYAELYKQIKQVLDSDYHFINTEISNRLNDLFNSDKELIQAIQAYNQGKQQYLEGRNTIFIEDNILSDQIGEVDNFEDYFEKRQQLIKQLFEQRSKYRGDYTQEQATEWVDNYLQKYQNAIYSQYKNQINYIEKVREKFGDVNSQVQKLIIGLDSQVFKTLINKFSLKDISSWQELAGIISYLADPETAARIQNLTKNTEIAQSSYDQASQNYNFYSSLKDQLKSSKSKTIKKSEYEQLDAQTQKYFIKIANGQYKLTKDAEEFYDFINNKSLQGFKNNIINITEKLNLLNNPENSNRNTYLQNIRDDLGFNTDINSQVFDVLSKSGYDVTDWIVKFSSSDIMERADALNQMRNALDSLIETQQDYDELLKQTQNDLYKNIYSLFSSAESIPELKKLYKETESSLESLTQSTEAAAMAANAYNAILIELTEQLDLKTLDTDELQNFADYLQQIAEQTEDLNNELKQNDKAAQIVAKSIMKMNDGFDQLGKNWDAWLDIIQNSTDSSEQFANAIIGTKQVLAQLLDISQDYITNDFVKQHLDLITEASNGSTQAIDDLKSALTSSVIDIIIDENSLQDIRPQIESLIYEINTEIPNIQVGAELNNDDAFVSKLQELVNLCGLTTEQVNALFDTWGFEPTFVMQPQEIEQDSPIIYTRTAPTGRYDKIDIPNPTGEPTTLYFPETKQYSWQDGVAKSKGTMMVPALSTDGTVPKINTIIKKATSNFSNYSTRNAGGASSPKPQTKTKSTPKEKEVKPDTSTKETKKAVEDDRDIYREINLELDQISRQLSRIQKKQQRLFGKQLIDNLNQQSKKLDQHRYKLKEKQKLQQADLAQRREQLRLLGLVVNEQTGDIENYLDALGQRQGAINGLINQYNAVVESYNATTDKQTKDAIKDQFTEIERAIKDAEDEYKKVQSEIKEYDSLRKDFEDITDQLEEQLQKQVEINITKFKMAVEIRLDMGEAERDWNKFRREVLEGQALELGGLLKETEFNKLLKDITQNNKDIQSYFSINGNERGQLASLTDQVNNTIAEIEKMKNGQQSVYYDNMAQAMEDLANYSSKLQDSMMNVKDLIDQVDKAYLDMYDNIKDQIDEQLDDYEFLNDLIEHDVDLLQLLYGDQQYAAMNSYYEAQYNNQTSQIAFLRQAIALVKERWQLEEAAGNTETAKKLKDQYKDLVADLNSLVEASVKTLRDQYTNAINEIFDTLDKRVSGGLGTDYLQMEWELINKNADQYLDTINSAYAIQELERKYQKAINDNQSNVKNQKILTDLMNEQLDGLRAKDKLTQYDVDRAEKLLNIEQARMALEDQRNAKTSLRLKRDSQGNYSYVYAASQEDVSAAEEALAKAQNDLYNFDKDAYRKNLDDMLSAWKDFQSQYKDIVLDTSLTEEERVEKLALLRDQYGEYINNKVAENENIRTNLMESAFINYAELYNQDYDSYIAMIEGEKNALMSQLVPQWDIGIQKMIDKFTAQGGFLPVCRDAFTELENKAGEFQAKITELQSTAGEDFRRLRQGSLSPTATSFQEIIDKNDDLIKKIRDEEIPMINNLRDALKELIIKYQKVWEAADKASQKAHDTMRALRQEAANYAEQTQITFPDETEPPAQTLPEKPTPVQTTPSTPVTSGGEGGSGSSSSSDSGSSSGGLLPYWPMNKPSKTIEGIAGSIWLFGQQDISWNNQPDRENRLKEVFGPSGAKMYDKVQDMFNNQGYGYKYVPSHGIDYDYYIQWTYEKQKNKKKPPTTMATGGYTGEWGADGRWAILHQKELVLNAHDTKNMLDSVSIIRDMVSKLGGNISSKLRSLNGGYIMPVQPKPADELQQSVSIQASFPNVNSKREIEEAFSELVNMAAQRAMRRV